MSREWKFAVVLIVGSLTYLVLHIAYYQDNNEHPANPMVLFRWLVS